METALKLVDDLYALRDTFFASHPVVDAPRKQSIISAKLAEILGSVRPLAGIYIQTFNTFSQCAFDPLPQRQNDETLFIGTHSAELSTSLQNIIVR